MNRGGSVPKHPRIECGVCGMHISEKHLGRHRARRHPSCPSVNQMIEKSEKPKPQQPKSSNVRAATESTILSAEVQQAIVDQSKKPFSDTVRYVKVRISEQELIKLMHRGRIHHAVGKFFMYDSSGN